MFIRIPKMLNEENLKLADEMIATGSFNDGSASTGAPTQSVKKNLQLDLVDHPQKENFLRMWSDI
ncbi:MAG: hypothetical protein HOF74_05595 [Gammaproteobacteria bacterium]|jgi:predicted 2-oxoglutarate/Fe(II)-dependent dioxygenase YbiX|nr:hypothetical protein [Gammaproteobacteria bacterium]MBT3859284.1 hypothetical protein [Gammaproteobacteria bacterium]MBT3987974.1 hypothetical protein [Gammaproteobacteria bacterium]MBT4256279.1 hypothetical protein [Gammaproteobacteria bacterium]MBT4583063.1 hypothetical protein [Gammaproteobacteria bacterium]